MSFRTTLAALGLGLTLLGGCASAPMQQQANPGCYWPGPTYADCREIIEFNGWR
jgi:hypothetical protein